MKNVSVFSKAGRVTREMKQLFSIAVSMELAILANPMQDPGSVLVTTAKRMLASGNYKKEWVRHVLSRYAKPGPEVLAAHKDTIDSIWSLNRAGYKTY